MNKKLIFLDIDGTLIAQGQGAPPDSALAAIRAAQAAGHRVFISTGRNLGMTEPVLVYGFDGVSCSAGGLILMGGRTVFDQALPPEKLDQIRSLLHENGVYCAAETRDLVYGDEEFREVFHDNVRRVNRAAGQGGDIPPRMRVQPFSAYDGRPAYKVIYLCADEGRLAEPMRRLSAEFHFCMHTLPLPGYANGELICRDFDKGLSIRRVCAFLGVPVADSVAFGDSMNDLEMIKTAGVGVAMGNACAGLKEAAGLVCPAVDADGLAAGFEELGLTR